MPSPNKAHRKLEKAYKHFLETAMDDTLTTQQRRDITAGAHEMLKARDLYELLLREARGEKLRESLEGYWQLTAKSPDVEAPDGDLSLFMAQAYDALFEHNEDDSDEDEADA